MTDTSKAHLIEIAARWDAMRELLDGNEVGDFFLSFPEVRQVADLIAQIEAHTVINSELLGQISDLRAQLEKNVKSKNM